MMKTFYGVEARNKLKAGVDKLSDAVRTTLGPLGRNAVVQRMYGPPLVTKDGVTVAKEMHVEDKSEAVGAELVRRAAEKTNDAVGDGTTTSTVLAQELVRIGIEEIGDDAGRDVHAYRRRIEERAELICQKLDDMAVPVAEDAEKLEQVATISANNDPATGKLIAELMLKVGKDGVVTVDDSHEMGVKVEHVEGMQFARGFLTQYMMTDQERQVAELGDPVVIVTDYRVTSLSEIMSLIKPALSMNRKDIFLVCDALEGDAMTTVVMNGPMFKKNVNVVAVAAPGYGDRKKEMLLDICALTGATLISMETGKKLENVTEADYGAARKVTAEHDRTTIVGGSGTEAAINDRIAKIKSELKKTESTFDKDKLKERLGKLQGGVAVIKVGALTEEETKEKKYLIDDAVSAVRAAMQEGIVPGGGMALMRALRLVDPNNVKDAIGVACHAPFRWIVKNAGCDPDEVLSRVVGPGKKISIGFDAKRKVVVDDIVAAGVVDPVSVTKAALRNAVAVAGSILTTETLIVDVPEEKKNA